jgi:hypothetical protein
MMRKSAAILAFVVVAVVPGTGFADTLSDRVVITNNLVYASSDVSIPEVGSENPRFIGGSPIFGGDGWGVLNIFLTEPGTNIISDHLYSVASGARESCSVDGVGPDCIFFTSDPSTDPLIGTLCTSGSNFCIQETGALQDVTSMVTAQNGGRGIFANGTIQVQSDTDAVPEPGSLLLLGSVVASLATYVRRRKCSRLGQHDA